MSTFFTKMLIAVAIVALSGITSLAPVAAAAQVPAEEGWTVITNSRGVNVLACRKGNNLRAGFKLQAFRNSTTISKINMQVVHNGSAHWLGAYTSWGNIRTYSYNSSVPDRRVTVMVKNRDGSNRLFTGFTYSDLRHC